MTDLSDSAKLVYKAKHKIRFVTAASLFDGHDASINIMRRILQGSGAEVIHLGHNRSVDEVVSAALQEDVQGVAVSSYQGGHLEYFKYMLDLLRAQGGEHIKVFGGGGGVIVPGRDQGAARLRRRAHLLARGRPAHGAAGHDQRHAGALRFRSGAQGPEDAGADHHRARARGLSRQEIPRRKGQGQPGPGPRHHRHRRRGQELAHRRAGAALSPGPGRRAEDRDSFGRPDAPQDRRRAARRPHPHECDPRPERVHALARHARHRQRGLGRARRRDRRLPRGGLRPGDGRDRGHRAGRRRDRAARRRLALRHDPRVRRREPAREDRHARLRRFRRHQQVRPPRRRGRAARRAQAGAAQPRGVQERAGRDAGVRHHRLALQRRRRDRALPRRRSKS